MLPLSLLSLDVEGDRALPRYLRSRDEVWVARALSELEDLAGLAEGELDAEWRSRVEPALRAMGARRQAVEGIRLLVDRKQQTTIGSALDPRRIREVTFAIGCGAPPQTPAERDRLLAAAARTLGISAREVEEGLFADRHVERRRRAPSMRIEPGDLVAEYNLALVQGLFTRATRVDLVLYEAVRPVVRFMKLGGLLAELTLAPPTAVHATVSGPLALFRNTLKYGRALARFFGTLTAAPRFEATARCTIGGRSLCVFVDHRAPVARSHRLSAETDSPVERALVRDVRRSRSGFTLQRETRMVRAGRHLFFPDFALRREGREVLVEIVGYFTKDYLERKRMALSKAECPPLLLCVDTDLDCGEGAFTGHVVLPFRKRVDVEALFAAAERMWSASSRLC